MATQYAKYRRPDGDEAVLLSDPLSRGRYERKGFKYVGPVEVSPGLEPANPGRDGGLLDKVKGLDGNEIVKQATDVVVRKLAGPWPAQEAVEESALIRGKMAELGSFPIAGMDLPEREEKGEKGSSAQVTTGPFPNPVTPQPGSAVTVTGDQADEDVAMSGVTTGHDGATGVTDQAGEEGRDGAPTDGRRQRDGVGGSSVPGGAPDLQAGSPDAPTRRTTSKS